MIKNIKHKQLTALYGFNTIFAIKRESVW